MIPARGGACGVRARLRSPTREDASIWNRVSGLFREKAEQAKGGQRPFGSRALLAVLLAHCVSVLWLFSAAFGSGRLLYFRDLSTQYAPWYAFASEALRQGIWPLWNPTVNAGEPFLIAYPVDLVLLAFGGWQAPLGVGPALHLLLALAGGSWLARGLGVGPWPAWLIGAVYGLGGTLLSLVNLAPLFEAAAWAPWVIAAFCSLVDGPTARRMACFAILAAIQVSTLGAEVVLETALAGLVIAWRRDWLRPRCLLALLGALLLAAALAAPALLGVHALVAGTARAGGFPLSDALAFSLHPLTLLEVVLPLWLGTPHAFSDADYWGRAFFPDGYPYLLTLYLGVAVLLLAVQARRWRRLWALVVLGLLLAVGSHGPLGFLPEQASFPLRGPQKLFFLVHLAVALLAGFGLQRALGSNPGVRGPRLLMLLPGAALAALALAVDAVPARVCASLARLIPELLDPRASVAAQSTWPAAWLPASLIALGAGLALVAGGRWARLAAVAVVIDLVTVNGSVNPLAPASFYALRTAVAGLVEPARDGSRLFSYGVARTPGLRFEPIMAGATSDVWLYYLDRQSLLPLTSVLDGIDGAFDEDRTGWAPRGAALAAGQAVPSRFRDHHRRLQQAGVRWVLSFEGLPGDLALERARVKLPEIRSPLTLYEVRGALPRAFFVAERRIEPDPSRASRILADPGFEPSRTVLLPSEPPSPLPTAVTAPEDGRVIVRYEPVDAHTVRITTRTPPGLVVVLDGHHPGWTVDDGTGPLPLLRANGRYRVIPTPGGERVFTMRFRPRWRTPALLVAAVGLLASILMLARGGPRRAEPAERVAGHVLD